MVLPATYASALLLLLLSLVCCSIWPHLFKLSEPRWRFELFSIDFALGAVLLAMLAAYTLGTFGSEVSFADRMLIAGRQSEIWIAGAGVVFALGNVLLLAGVSLLGICEAFPIAFGLAATLTALAHAGAFRPALLGGGIACMLLCALAAILASRQRAKVRTTRARNLLHRGTAASLLAGLILGGSQFILRTTADPEFGPGPYAAVLMFSVGILIATPWINIFLMNIGLTGSTIGFKQYVAGGLMSHRNGLAAGAMWAIAALSVLLALSPVGEESPGPALVFAVPLASVLIVMILGRVRWRELSGSDAKTRSLVLASTACYGVGLVVFALGLTSRLR